MGVTTKTNYTKFQLKANKAEAGPEAVIVSNRERDDLFNFTVTCLQLQTASLKWAGLGWMGGGDERRGVRLQMSGRGWDSISRVKNSRVVRAVG